MNISEIREKYPAYNDLSDTDLAQRFHAKFYSDLPYEDFANRIGIGPTVDANPVPTVPGDPDRQHTPSQFPERQLSLTEKLFRKPGTPGEPVEVIPGAEPLQWMEQNPDIVGATAASILAPEIAAPAAIAKFGPAASQLFSQTAARVPAAFMGGAAGQEIGRQTGGVKTDPNAELSDILLDNIKAGGRMAAAEATAAMGLPLLTKAFAPGVSSLTPESSSLLNFAREKKVPTGPSAFSPNVTAKAAEGTTDAFLPSRLVNDAYRKTAVVRFNQLMTEIPEEIGTIEGNKIITTKATAEIGEFLKQSRAAGKNLSKEFIEAIGPTTSVKATNTLDLFKRVKKTATDQNLLNWIEAKSKQLKTVSAEELEEALRQVGGIKPQSDKKWLEEIRTAIKEDFRSAGAPMEKLAESNKAFSSNFALTSNKFAREFSEEMARGGDGTRFTVQLFRSGNESFLNALAKEAEKKGGKISIETWDNLRAQNLQNMILNSSVNSKRLLGLRTIDGFKLEKILDANKEVLSVAYKDRPQTIEAMRNLARLAKAAAEDTAAFEKGMSDILKQGNVGTFLGAFGAALAGHGGPLAGLLVGSATAPLLAKSLMNPKGWAKRWLTTGFEPVRTAEGLRLGGRLVFSDGSQE